jgi:hypothetical protein
MNEIVKKVRILSFKDKFDATLRQKKYYKKNKIAIPTKKQRRSGFYQK